MTLDKPCKGHRFITGLTARCKQPDTFVPTGNSESTINLNFMCLECERKQANPVGFHSDWGKHANSKQTEPDPVGNQTGPSSCEAQGPTIALWWLVWWILRLKVWGWWFSLQQLYYCGIQRILLERAQLVQTRVKKKSGQTKKGKRKLTRTLYLVKSLFKLYFTALLKYWM